MKLTPEPAHTELTDLTSPEAAERLAKTCDVAAAIAGRRRHKAQHAHYKNCAATLHALSAERGALISARDMLGEWWARDKARADAAGAERDALKAELAEAKMHVSEMITAFEEHVALPDKNCSCHISPPCSDCTENDYARETLSEARAFLDRHQKGQTDD